MSVFQWIIDGLVIFETLGVLAAGIGAYLLLGSHPQAKRMMAARPDQINQVGKRLSDTARYAQYTVPDDQES